MFLHPYIYIIEIFYPSDFSIVRFFYCLLKLFIIVVSSLPSRFLFRHSIFDLGLAVICKIMIIRDFHAFGKQNFLQLMNSNSSRQSGPKTTREIYSHLEQVLDETKFLIRFCS